MTWNDRFLSWEKLLERGRERSVVVKPRHAYLVDPSAGMESIASLFAVALVPDTQLLWAVPSALDVPSVKIAEALHSVAPVVEQQTPRPLWGVGTSGSSGASKMAIGYADLWELIVLHYERAFTDVHPQGDHPNALATCLPLQFSATFFMTVLPAMFQRRDLLVFPAHDWTPVSALAATTTVLALGVPSGTVAAALGQSARLDMSGVTLLLGGGHVSQGRLDVIQDRFAGVLVGNLYGTAETGAVSVDFAPGHNRHVGRPLVGKSVWLADQDPDGIGRIAAAGPDCCDYLWRPGRSAEPVGDHVAATDYGRFDDAGNLCLEGRVDGGEKLRGLLVYPRRVERHLLRLPGVLDARVLIRRNENGLEHLVARVVGTVGKAEVQEHCAALPDVERPRLIEIFSENDSAAYSAHGKL